MTRQRLVIGNWKMNGSLKTNQQLLEQLVAEAQAVQSNIVVCVPHPYLAQTQGVLSASEIEWGAQNISPHAQGAYTGEVSTAMLLDFNCQWVLVGHSERRTLFGETDADVLLKTQAALAADITPIVCVGETEKEYSSGQTEGSVLRQLQSLLELPAEQLKQIVVAYEPVWAIGTGKSATPEQAQHVHAYIRGLLAHKRADSVRILYGGSVNGVNAKSLFAMPDIDGALVGGASLNAVDFLSIAVA